MTPEHGSKLDARLGTINQNEISIVERDTVAVHVNAHATAWHENYRECYSLESVIPYKASVVKAHSFNAAKTV